MKKIYIVFVLIFLTSSAYADKLLKSGFLSGEWKLPKIKNPFSWIPVLDEIFCNGMLILVERSKV